MRDRLYRCRGDRVLFGVCGGVADWLDLDPSLVRIVFALLVITGGIGFLLYIIMAIVVPAEPDYVHAPMAPGIAPVGGMPTPDAAAGGVAAGPGAAAGSVTDATDAAATGGAPAVSAAAPSAAGFQPGTLINEREARRAARHSARHQRRAARDERAGMIFGVILVIVGIWFLVRRYIPWFDTDFFGPIALIVIGAIVLAKALGRNQDDDPVKPR